VWHGRVWLIDHGATFFRQHGEAPLHTTARSPFPMIAEHVLLDRAGSVPDADARLAAAAAAAIDDAVALVPEVWLGDDPDERRADFAGFLAQRLAAPRDWVAEVERARA